MGDLQWNLNNKWTKLECYCYTVQLIANWIKVIAWWNCTPVEREECSEKAFALNGCDNCLCNDDNGDLNLGLMVMEKNASRRNFLIALQVGLELLARVGIRTIKSRILWTVVGCYLEWNVWNITSALGFALTRIYTLGTQTCDKILLSNILSRSHPSLSIASLTLRHERRRSLLYLRPQLGARWEQKLCGPFIIQVSLTPSLALSHSAPALNPSLMHCLFLTFLACKCMQRSLRAHGAAADEIKVRAEWCFWCLIVPQNAALIRPHA
jgi:hypothetical protein